MATTVMQEDNSRQLALNPNFNVWVSASAGTGKTKILTDRLLMLLLTDIDPQKILCLTFTKAAASEMRERLLHQALEWSICSEEKLIESLNQFLESAPSQEQQMKARSLFMILINGTPGIRITTIHSFCQSLLTQFPIEAGISPAFKILAEHESHPLLKQALEETLAFSSTTLELKQAITLLTENLHVVTFQEIIESLIARPERLQKILNEGLEAATQKLEEMFGCHHTQSPEDYVKEYQKVQQLEDLHRMRVALAQGGKTDIARSEAIHEWITLKSLPTIKNFEEYAGHFLTLDGEIRKNLVSTSVSQKFPDVLDLLSREAHLIQEIFQRQKSLLNMKMTKALYQLGLAILEKYERLKKMTHALDYNDLIQKARFLLTDSELCSWVLYKLDGGIDHILIDEAQDTNESQWDIIQALTEEFYAGESARSTSRTLFAVGDPKQSIYSFQGTSPVIFEKKKSFYQQKIQAAQKNFYTLSLEKSYRSTAIILEAVDAVCSDEDVRMALNKKGEAVRHISHHQHKGGKVELWPLLESDDKEITGREQLSVCLAKKIKELLDQKTFLHVRGRPIEASDILILLRERSSLMASLILSLKKEGIPVAGPDRLSLLNEIAIQDLIALGDFLLLPEDDLTLACILKSPLIGLEEEDLFELAYDRQEDTLWQRLQKSLTYQASYVFLSDLRNKVDYVGPFSLYSDLLNRLGGRQKFQARLGEECRDGIEEFLTLCLEYENTHCASLQEFLTWIKATDIEVKRDFSKANSGVRVMTVHGAKGLQAPVVILADTTTKPVWREKFLWQEKPNPLLLWASSHDELPRELKKIKERLQEEQQAEYWRLLYVAMTRAEEHLYIAGVKMRASIKGTWYEVLLRALAPLSHQVEFKEEFLRGSGLQLWKKSQIKQDIEVKFEAENNYSLPAYFQNPIDSEETLSPLISATIEENLERQEKTFQEQLLRKLLNNLSIHRSIEYEKEAQKIYENFFPFVFKGLFEKYYKAVLHILTDPKLSFLFTGPTYVDVPFAGYPKNKPITGQIDRVTVQEEMVYIITYKIGVSDLPSKNSISSEDKKEIEIYQKVIQDIFPDKEIKCYFLWLETGQLREI